MANALTETHLAPSLSDRINGLVRRYRAARAHHAAYLRAYADLQGMSDRELTELGLFRSDLAVIARQEADRATAAI